MGRARSFHLEDRRAHLRPQEGLAEAHLAVSHPARHSSGLEEGGQRQKGPARAAWNGGLEHTQEDDEAIGKNSPGQAGTLRNILAGGTWPQTRLAE
eukprot:13669092-Heterocapsa_arctica.AAC.1